MAPVSRRGGLRLVRPLLDLSKADLIALCDAAGQPFFQDPSNVDPRFARTGLKRILALFAEEGLGTGELLRLGRRAARADEALRLYVEDLRERLAPRLEEGRFECAANALALIPMEALLRILDAEIARIGGSNPRLDRLERLAAQLRAAMMEGLGFRGTLAGVLVSVTPNGRFAMVKAPPRRQQAP
jgi:tRNA(Ile)-lysidine synthase